ncbi:MAG TPA: alpha/beta fold hydrolase [Sphingomicrobium sp.]|nr:alpha/beta fold hydrolase [Sphingomicrobium sp.]
MRRILVAAAILAAITPVPTAAQMKPVAMAPASPIPVAVFGQLPDIADPVISPDGKTIAAKMKAKGEQYLAILPLSVPNPIPRLIAKDGDFDELAEVRAIDWAWADNDNLLIWVAARENLEGQPYDATRVIAYNYRTGKRTLLGWDGAFVQAGNVLWRSLQGPPRILLSRFAAGRGTERIWNPEVIEVDVQTGRHKSVVKPHPTIKDWYADGKGVVRMGTSFDRDSGTIRVMYRPDEATPFRTILKQKTAKYDAPPVPQFFLPGEKAIVLSRKDGFNAVYELDLNTMELGKRLFGLDAYDVASVTPTRTRDGLSRINLIEDRARRIYFEPRLKEIQAILDETFGASNATIVSTDEPRENIIVHVGAPNQAGAFHLFNTETGDLKRIGWVNNALKDMKLNPVSTIRYRASDGKTVSAVLTMPRLKPGQKRLAAVVLPHGGPWARDSESFDMWAQPLAELGYVVVQPNFRGSSGFGKEWESASDGNWGTRMQDDLNDAVAHLAAQDVIDSKRVCIFGWSYGGYAASRAAQRDGDKYRCAISGAGVHDLPDMVAYDKNYLGQYGSKYIGAAASKLAEVSPARHAKDYSAPILIVHGEKDQRVPVDQSRKLARRLKAAGKVEGRDFVYIEQPRNTHHLPLEEDRIQLIEAVKKFLERHNPA